MKRNFNQVIKAYNGEPLKKKDGTDQKFGELIAMQLYSVNYGKNAEQKLQAFRLCNKLADNPEKLDITAEDGALIKEVVANTCAAGIYGQVVDLVDKE